MDGGKGSLKVCLSMVEKYKKSSKYSTAGVNAVFLLFISFDVQENYFNIKLIWELLNLGALNCLLTVDLKIANILAGLMPHSALYPCTWCEVKSDELKYDAELRTLSSIKEKHKEFEQSGLKKNECWRFKNCINEPIITTEGNDIILHLIVPPVLHLMMGAVNTVYDHMQSQMPDIVCEWAKQCNVTKDRNFGSGFNGNACRKLLKNVEKLHVIRIQKDLDEYEDYDLYIKVLQTLNYVVISCFGHDLHPLYETHIKNFAYAYNQISGLRVTPKVHTIIHHVPQFLGHRNEGLGSFSEHAFEAIHYSFNDFYENFKQSDVALRLSSAVCSYNAKNVIIQ